MNNPALRNLNAGFLCLAKTSGGFSPMLSKEFCKIGNIRITGKRGGIPDRDTLHQVLFSLSKSYIDEILLNAFSGVLFKQAGKISPVQT